MAHLNWMDRYGPGLMMVQAGLCLMALRFGAIVMNGGSPITPEIYGPAVYAFPAIWWATIQGVSALVAFIGVGLKIPAVVVIGALPNVILQAVFYGLSGLADQGTLLQTGTLFITLPICLVTLWAGIEGVIHGRR